MLGHQSISEAPISSLVSETVIVDTILANRAKPISRARWLFEGNISGTQRFSSEDMEKP